MTAFARNHVSRAGSQRRRPALGSGVIKAALFALGIGALWLLPHDAAAQTQVQVKPRILIIFDVSGSMQYNVENGNSTYGDGSWDPWGSRFCCPGAGNSRMYAAKEAMRQMIFATGDIEFALMKFPQEYTPTTVDQTSTFYEGNQVAGTNNDALRYGGDGCLDFVSYGDDLDYQWLCVEFPDLSMPDNRGPIMMWMDHHEFADEDTPDTVPVGWSRAEGTATPNYEQELRATQYTPLANSMLAAEDYLNTVYSNEYTADPQIAECRPYSVIVLTDGDEYCSPTPWSDPGQKDQAVRDAATSLHTVEHASVDKTVTIWPIAFAYASSVLDEVAQTGLDDPTAKAFSASSTAELSGVLYEIVSSSILVEVCNQEDDDCDGDIDEDFRDDTSYVDRTYCYQSCPDGWQDQHADFLDWYNTGSNDTLVPETTTVPVDGDIMCASPPECACDGIDNNCDGEVDEEPSGGWPIYTGTCGGCGDAGADCVYNADSRCKRGNEVCVKGEGYVCVADVGPATETCNGIDDDCNGVVDDIEVTEECGLCGDSMIYCVNGQLECCGPGTTSTSCEPYTQPVPETCNTLDDDCDGLTDEDIRAPCGGCEEDYCDDPNAGICQQGIMDCVDGTDGECQGAIGPGTETCNNLDDDCDGETDEELPIGGVCSTCGGNWYCVDGAEACCSGLEADGSCIAVGAPQPETCNGVDDDCDGETDEEIAPRACMNPDTYLDRAGVGICRAGIQQCQNGAWGFGETAATWEADVCGYQQLPETEVCDCLDNDCDGETDEAEDIPELGTECSACGVWQCVGCYLSCVGEGTAETCNGLDDNCNGLTDELTPLACGGCVEPIENPPEDEPPAVIPELLEDCLAAQAANPDIGPDEGECREGARVCDPDAADPNFLWTECRGATPPTPEVCDGKDNDCDALTDEDEDIDQVGQQCATAIGECEDGWWQCVDNGEGAKSLECCKEVTAEGVCVPPQGPVVELCNGLDDDCDGATDDDLAGTGAECGEDQGICEPGTYECTYDETDGWDIRCVGNTGGTDEECNGLDDDCNGLVDDGLPIGDECTNDPGGAPPDGICDIGNYECFEGEWVCNATVPADEICDGLDNNCDGLTDEDLVVECPQGSICIEGECAIPCVGEELSCPAQDMTCVNIEDDEGQTFRICVADVCNEDSEDALPCVNNPYYCDDGQEPLCKCNPALKQCVSICNEVACPEGTVCVPITGNCRSLDDGCYAEGCPSGEVCVAGECIADPCDGVTCDAGEYCNADGDCVDACYDVDCPVTCFEGECVDPCDGVSCDGDDETCNPLTGVCETDGACNGVSCKYYQTCQAGECVEDPCWRITCPNGFQCQNGTCFEYGSTTSGGDVDGDVDGDADTDGDDDDDDNGDGDDDDDGTNFGMDKVLATGAGGCLCAAAPGATPAQGSGFLMLLLGGLLFAWRLARRPHAVTLALMMVWVLGLGLAACNTEPFDFENDEGAGDSDDSSDDSSQGGGEGEDDSSDSSNDRDTSDTSCKEDGEDNDCDGEDDDCDGEIDEDVDLQTNTYHCGECNNNCNDLYENATGICKDGSCSFGACDLFFHDLEGTGDECSYYCRQTAEQDRCNGVDFQDGSYVGDDDDCDGQTDEDVNFDDDPLNCGRCGNRCVFPHAIALCQDGECTYEECDANFYDIDEAPENGCEYSCEPTPDRETPETELCNRVDDDCDGQTDEGNPEAGSPCYTPGQGCQLVDGEYVCQGMCQAGTSRCINGSVVCEGQVTPRPVETCDDEALDENCNGVADSDQSEGLFRLCQTGTYEETGSCRNGISSCVGGGWGPCENEVLPTDEICDGLDNDCDGTTDLIDGSPIVGESCGDCGQMMYCARGTMACCLGVDATGDCVVPGAETCNNVDDDCDGTTDEVVETLCDGPDADACKEGLTTCVDGVEGCSDETDDSVELCDGVDNDCNGDVDDNPTAPPADYCNEACGDKLLSVTCEGELGWKCNYNCVEAGAQDGSGVQCDAQDQVVGSETWCNGYDDDCDGDTDENLINTVENCGGCGNDCWSLVPDNAHVASLACVFNSALGDSGEWECRINACVDQYWDLDATTDTDLDCEYGPCGGAGGVDVAPEGDTCDSIDNDCDGSTDNGPDSSEETCNGVDDDCDDLTDTADDDLSAPDLCNPQCPNAGEHTTQCDGADGFRCHYSCADTGEIGVECDTPYTLVADETRCDGFDNDCDGSTDEGLLIAADTPAVTGTKCNNGLVGGCYQEGIVKCNPSPTGVNDTLVCCDASETNAVCQADNVIGAVSPGTEGTTPDGLDNDCDGYIDDGTTGCVDSTSILVPGLSGSGDYYIFQYEASKAGTNPESPVACSANSATPWTNISFADAREACLRLNAYPGDCSLDPATADSNPDDCWDLCSTKQWFFSCAYADSVNAPLRYPYGDTYQDQYCNGVDNDADGLTDTGDLAQCIADWSIGGASGDAWDLSGNVEEWTLGLRTVDAQNLRVIRGGSYKTVAGGLTCGMDFWAADENALEMDQVGFRCCKGPEPMTDSEAVEGQLGVYDFENPDAPDQCDIMGWWRAGDDPDATNEASDWEFGIAASSNTPGANNSSCLWATDLDGNYNRDSWLYSPIVDMSDVAGGAINLVWRMYFDNGGDTDDYIVLEGRSRSSTDGGDTWSSWNAWTALSERGTSNDQINTNTSWATFERALDSLFPTAGTRYEVHLRFFFQESGTDAALGAYIDDIRFEAE